MLTMPQHVLRSRLLVLYRIDGHALWVSPKVLDLLLDKLPSEVEGGIIVRDGDGNPTGARRLSHAA